MTITAEKPTDPLNPFFDNPTSDAWQPTWLVDVGQDVMVGITLDDGCYVVLTQTSTGQWRPTTHVPVEAAKQLGRLTND